MQVTITISDEIAAQAEAAGKTAQVYVEDLVASSLPLQPLRRKVMTAQELEDFFEAMSQYSHKIPYLPDEALTRESIYSDHD